MSIKLCTAKFKSYNSEKIYNIRRPRHKSNFFCLYIVDMQEKRKGADYIIKKIHVKSINVTIQHGTNSLKKFVDMDTPTNFRQ